MKLKSTGGRVVHAPLSFSFQMLELGGSYIQKYNTVLLQYVPNRTLTPYRMQPQLIIADPDNNIPTGEYTSYLTNVLWTVKLYKNKTVTTLAEKINYTVDSMHALTFRKNVATDEIIHIEFSADYVDENRGDVAHFTWSRDLTTLAESEMNINLTVLAPSKVNFSPFKTYGEFPIEAVLKNGDQKVSLAVYKWQVFNYTTKQWRDISDAEDIWYVSGRDKNTLIVDTDFVQKELVRVVAYPKASTASQESVALLLRRFYGQWEDTPEFAYAKFVQNDTKQAMVQVKVTNRQGDIAKPMKYFDIEMFYRASKNDSWRSLGNGTEAVITRGNMTKDHEVGDICRELSAYQPIELPDGTLLADETGALLCGRFPTSDREID